jgi:dTDP-4-dehydrorhamnose 3,5-epimerase-like enzyme
VEGNAVRWKASPVRDRMQEGTAEAKLADVRWYELQSVADERGRLTVVEGERHIPFPIARVFYVHDVVGGVDRGAHAHRDTDQLAMAVSGSLKIDVSDGIETRSYELVRPDRGLYLPRMIWVRLYDFSPGAVCLVLASTPYDAARSIRTWAEYLRHRGLKGAGRSVATGEGGGSGQ